MFKQMLLMIALVLASAGAARAEDAAGEPVWFRLQEPPPMPVADESGRAPVNGIALYYAGRFKDCRAQFESHRTVNPDDVENAAWHFLCVARAESVTSARAALLPVGPDPRVPMRQIYQMFRGAFQKTQVSATFISTKNCP